MLGIAMVNNFASSLENQRFSGCDRTKDLEFRMLGIAMVNIGSLVEEVPFGDSFAETSSAHACCLHFLGFLKSRRYHLVIVSRKHPALMHAAFISLVS
ncbi:hypothetical protein QE152_g15553 [Popillia japonica]|uniref:Uncharacterized protein n=1 Tax=Popillia japonica TaxID=7064 RepID=A0AAW1L7P1_POPJA